MKYRADVLASRGAQRHRHSVRQRPLPQIEEERHAADARDDLLARATGCDRDSNHASASSAGPIVISRYISDTGYFVVLTKEKHREEHAALRRPRPRIAVQVRGAYHRRRQR